MPRIEVESEALDTLKAMAQRLQSERDDLLKALTMALPFMEQESEINGYGYYRPDNPHNFTPDHECCNPAEIEAHKMACEAYDRGEYTPEKGDGWIAPNLHILKAPWGIGSYCEDIPELKERCDFARAIIAKCTSSPKVME